LSASEKARGSEEGECSTRGEAVTVVAEATRLAVFGYRGRRTIGCLLVKGGNTGEKDGYNMSSAADTRRNQPQDLGQPNGLRENLLQVEDWRQKQDCQQR